MSTPPPALELPIQCPVILGDIVSRPELNGQVAHVVQLQKERGRYGVQLLSLPGREEVSVAPSKVRAFFVPIVEIARTGTLEDKCKMVAHMRNLATGNEAVKRAIVAVDGIAVLIEILRGDAPGPKENAVATLLCLANEAINKPAIAAAGGVEALIEIVRSGNDKAKGFAANALAAMILAYERLDEPWPQNPLRGRDLHPLAAKLVRNDPIRASIEAQLDGVVRDCTGEAKRVAQGVLATVLTREMGDGARLQPAVSGRD